MKRNQRDHYRSYGLAATMAEATDPVERLHTAPLEAPTPRTLGARLLTMMMIAAGAGKAKVQAHR